MAVWQPIDFHGIVTLDKSIIVELTEYLSVKEGHLAYVVSHAIHPAEGDMLPPSLTPVAEKSMSLDDGIALFNERLRQCAQDPNVRPAQNDWKDAAEHINASFWNYVELLEGVVTEFFQQLDQIGFERWNNELISVVESIKTLLSHKLRQAAEGIDQLEELLKSYQRQCETSAGFFTQIQRLIKGSLLDKDLKKNIGKTEKFLGFRYQTFMHRVEQYNLLQQSTAPSTKKFESYMIFEHFDETQKNSFIHLYQWLRIWELNQTTKSLPEREPVRAIRGLQSPEKALRFFRTYEKLLRQALFSRSRAIKMQPYSVVDLIGKIQHQHALQGQMAELHTLGNTARKYRDFLLRTDPNPYIRSRLGFGEWIVGPEPAIAKLLTELIYDIEGLDELFNKLMKSIEEGDISDAAFHQVKDDIQRILHEMAQPLTSYPLMLSKGRAFVRDLEQINELGSTHAEVVDIVGDALSRALRSDWKFHVLQEINEFKQAFAIHQGIVGPMVDRIHENRVERFTKIIGEIREWVKNNDTHSHLGEIEADVSDLKGYLQDFLAHAQRFAKESETEEIVDPMGIRDITNQLLEYRCLFGHFFHQLRRDRSEERVIRNQFLFVDQYFESVENILYDLKSRE